MGRPFVWMVLTMNGKNHRTPIYEALKDYIENVYFNFHTPGHCQGKWVEKDLKKTLGDYCFKSDLTELPGLDNLHSPQSSIKKSEEFTAKFFGADHTKYLVNGATAGVIASILYCVKKGEKILIPRNAHKSVYNGVILSGALPEYVPLRYLDNGFPLNIDPEILTDKLLKNHSKAFLLTNPSYYGVCIRDLKKINNKAGKGALMIIDEAHGAHLNFCKKLPGGASKNNADIWVQSIHKNLGSLTQSAMLHWREDKIDGSKLKLMLQLIQTTSPSYLLLLSLELARCNLEKSRDLWDDFIERIIKFRKDIEEKISGINLLEREIEASPCYNLDLTKLTLFTDKLGLTGYKMAQILREEYNILVELAGYDHVLFFMTLAHDNRDLSHLFYALKDISQKYKNNYSLKTNEIPPDISEGEIAPGNAIKMRSQIINLEEAEGKISADFIVSYPPGIPVLVPGEIINGEIINYLNYITSVEESFLEGVIEFDNKRKGIKVIEE